LLKKRLPHPQTPITLKFVCRPNYYVLKSCAGGSRCIPVGNDYILAPVLSLWNKKPVSKVMSLPILFTRVRDKKERISFLQATQKTVLLMELIN